MPEARKYTLLLAVVIVAISVVAFAGWRIVTITAPPSLIFAASCFAVLPYIIGGCAITDCFTGVIPAGLLPARWRLLRKSIVQIAAFAILAAVAIDLPPALWVAIASGTGGAWWMLGAHDKEVEREEYDQASKAQKGS